MPTNETLIELVRVVVQEAGGKIPLTELGGSVRALAAKRCLQAKFEGQEIHKKVKSKGGWESCAGARARRVCCAERLPLQARFAAGTGRARVYV